MMKTGLLLIFYVAVTFGVFYTISLVFAEPFHVAHIIYVAWDFFWRYPLINALVCAGAVSAVLITVQERQNRRYLHIDGPILLEGARAIRHANHVFKSKISTCGLMPHPGFALPRASELGNFFLFGMQGSGKSTIIKGLLRQVFRRQCTALIYDEKGEYTELFLDGETCVLSPGDVRSVYWELSKDITTHHDARTFADAIISPATNEPFWTDAAKILVTGALVSLIETTPSWGWADFHKRLFGEPEKLRSALIEHFPEATFFTESDQKATASVQAVVATQLSWLRYIEDAKPDNAQIFSLKDWFSESKKQKVIVKTNHANASMSASLFLTLFSMMTNKVLSLPDSKAREIWVVLDELAAISKNTALEVWLSRCRSKGARTIAGTQILSQVQQIYGERQAETILSLFSTVYALKLGAAGGAAETCSKLLGQRAVYSESTTVDERGGKSVTRSEKDVPLVQKESLIHLDAPDKKGVSGYLTLPVSRAIYKLKWPYPSLKAIAPASVPINKYREVDASMNQCSERKKHDNPFMKK